MHTDFSNTDHPEKNIKYSLAMDDACSGSCAPELIWSSVINLIINLFGVFTYGSIVAALSPLILALLLISALITYLISRWQRNYGIILIAFRLFVDIAPRARYNKKPLNQNNKTEA